MTQFNIIDKDIEDITDEQVVAFKNLFQIKVDIDADDKHVSMACLGYWYEWQEFLGDED